MIHNSSNKLEDRFIAFTRWIGSVQSVIIHTCFFFIAMSLPFFGVDFQKVLLIVTTIVSFEAIYLSIFIQMSVNRTVESLASVEQDIDEIQEDIDEIGDDVEEISEDMEEIQKDIDEIQEDVEDLNEEEDKKII